MLYVLFLTVIFLFHLCSASSFTHTILLSSSNTQGNVSKNYKNDEFCGYKTLFALLTGMIITIT